MFYTKPQREFQIQCPFCSSQTLFFKASLQPLHMACPACTTEFDVTLGSVVQLSTRQENQYDFSVHTYTLILLDLSGKERSYTFTSAHEFKLDPLSQIGLVTKDSTIQVIVDYTQQQLHVV